MHFRQTGKKVQGDSARSRSLCDQAFDLSAGCARGVHNTRTTTSLGVRSDSTHRQMTAPQTTRAGMRESICAALINGPQQEADGTYTFQFRFPVSDPEFAGHFPGHPLLPGIFQVEMTRWASESVLGSRLEIREIVRAKFLRPILPEETIR